MVGETGRVVSCCSCGTKNNLPSYSFQRRPWCGSCGAALAEPPGKRIARSLYQGRYLLIIFVGLGLLLIWQPADFIIDFSNSGMPSQGTSRKDDCATHPQPNQGVYARYTRRADVAPLTLKTQSGSNYFVKIDDAVTGKTAVSFYIYGGTSFETQVPGGTFIVKYATSSSWCDDRELFGPSTKTNKADRVFQFDDEYSYTIELISRPNGNLPAKRIGRDAF